MNRNEDSVDRELDRVLASIRNDTPDDSVTDAAARRVLARLVAARDASDAHAPLLVCSDFQAEIPKLVSGKLPESRRLLVEDHTRACLTCRRALRAAKARGGATRRGAARGARKARSWWSADLSWGVAAMLLIGVALVGLAVRGDLFDFQTGGWIRVENIDGDLFEVADVLTTPVNAGTVLEDGESIRTGKESGATFRLADGTIVEMNERSQIAVVERGGETYIDLERGDIIVTAAEQGGDRLYVRTDDCDVAVRGTVFSVSRGTKGSRVSVIEGEVEVAYDGTRDVLRPGQQATTNDRIARIPVEQDIAWSRNLDRHVALLNTVKDIGDALERRLPDQGLRTSTRLLDAAPDGTVVYLALPNLTPTLTEAHRLLKEKMSADPALAAWWQGAREHEDEIDRVMEKVRRFGSQLGDEVALALYRDEHGSLAPPVVLTTVRHPAAFREAVEEEIVLLAREAGMEPDAETGTPRLPVRFVDSPVASAASGEGRRDDALLFRQLGDLLIVSPELEAIARVESGLAIPEASPFKASRFHASLAQEYAQGTGILFGVDLKTILGDASDASRDPAFEIAGIGNVEDLIVERYDAGEHNVTRASLTFADARRGLASWLAEPAPMGGLEFFSPDALLASAFVVKTPSVLFDELLTLATSRSGDLRSSLETAENREELVLVEDLIDALGGEVAFGLDGPLLPNPAWKLVVEVYDSIGAQNAIASVIDRVNAEVATQGGAFRVELSSSEHRGRTFWSITPPDARLGVHYTFVDGYLVAAPQRVLVDRAITLRKSGISLASSKRFTDQLPRDGHDDFSAVLYQDLGRLLKDALDSPIAQSVELSPEQRAQVERLVGRSVPTVLAAYGSENRIVVVGHDRGDLIFGSSLNRLFDVASFADVGRMLERAGRADVYDDASDDAIVPPNEP